MLELHNSNFQSEQIRPPNGKAFWSFSADVLRDLTIEDDFVTKVRWQGREWICKRDERTLNEVVGYQIASTIGLPLQPWLAFESPAPRSIGAGIFIEWWNFGHLKSRLVDLGADHAALMARGLAFSVFSRAEWPEWLLSNGMRELRLIDLDGTGPQATVPPSGRPPRAYIRETKSIFDEALRTATLCGISNAFITEIRRLLEVDLASAVDLSGYPNASAHERAMLCGLAGRQRRLSKLLPAE